MKNNKGLSTVVTTLIIILLVLVAVGIIWGVVNNLLGKSKGTIESSTKCLDLEIRATKVVEWQDNSTGEPYDGNYNVTLRRTASGDDEAIYAKLVFYRATGNTPVLDFGVSLLPLETKTEWITSAETGNFTSASKVEVTTYYLDESGNEKLCPAGTTEFNF